MKSVGHSVRVAILMAGLSLGLGMGAAAMATPPAWSNSGHGNSQDGYEYANVVRTDPIVRQVRVETPRRECWDETRTVTENPHISDPQVGGRTLLGGIIGGVIGHQFGSGQGRDAATVAGVAIGAGVGYDSARRAYGTRQTDEVVQRCQVRYDNQYEERIEGYHVTYAFNGREYTTRMPYDPGSRIRVRVAVSPAE
ncbi:MAG: glycine zipper 2TM domain-containing protein [Povalibacter sp.]